MVSLFAPRRKDFVNEYVFLHLTNKVDYPQSWWFIALKQERRSAEISFCRAPFDILFTKILL